LRIPGARLPGQQQAGEFKETFVDMQGEKTGSDASLMKEVSEVVAVGGTIKFDILHRIRAAVGGGSAAQLPTGRALLSNPRAFAERNNPLGARPSRSRISWASRPEDRRSTCLPKFNAVDMIH
jgi:hypothetical protein